MQRSSSLVLIGSFLVLLVSYTTYVETQNKLADQKQRLERVEKESEEKYQTLLGFMNYYRIELEKTKTGKTVPNDF